MSGDGAITGSPRKQTGPNLAENRLGTGPDWLPVVSSVRMAVRGQAVSYSVAAGVGGSGVGAGHAVAGAVRIAATEQGRKVLAGALVVAGIVIIVLLVRLWRRTS